MEHTKEELATINRLIAQRKKLGLTISRAAKLAGLSVDALGRFERGMRIVSNTFVNNLEEAYIIKSGKSLPNLFSIQVTILMSGGTIYQSFYMPIKNAVLLGKELSGKASIQRVDTSDIVFILHKHCTVDFAMRFGYTF